MSKWVPKPIGDLFHSNFPGEWGADPSGVGELVRVFRGADFVSSGRLQRDGGAARRIVRSKLKKVELQPGDILLEKSGGSPDQPVGRVSYFEGADGPATASNFLQTLRPADGLDSKFIFYLLQNEYVRGRVLPFQQQTTGIINFRLKDYLGEKVAVPATLDEQRRIADLLSAVDEQIGSIETEIAKRKLQFVGLQRALLSCSSFKEDDVDDIQLRELIPMVQYGISTSLEPTGVVPVLRMNNLGKGEIDVSDLKYSPRHVRPEMLLKDGDVLFNRTNSMEHVGRTSIWRSQLAEATFASYLVRLFPDENRITKQYLVYLLGWEEHQTQMRRYATPGVQQVNINPTNLRLCKVRVPRKLSAQRRVVEALDACREYISALTADVEKLRLKKRGLALDLLTSDGRASS